MSTWKKYQRMYTCNFSLSLVMYVEGLGQFFNQSELSVVNEVRIKMLLRVICEQGFCVKVM